MPTPPRWSARRLAGRAIVAAVLGLAALPIYLSIAPSWRPVAVRLSAAVVVAVGCAHARRWARSALGPPPISPLDTPPPLPPAAELDARFLRLRDEIISSIRSRRYFEAILWPRLSALAGTELPRPTERRVPRRRGPSLSVLAGLIAAIEERR